MSAAVLARVRRRGAWVAALGLGVAALVTVALTTTAPEQVLDPDDSSVSGGRAIAQVLRTHGVDVEVVRDIDALAAAAPGAGTTVVMANPAYLGHDSALALRRASAGADRLVLLDPTSDHLSVLGLPLTSSPVRVAIDLEARCDGATTVARAHDTTSLADVRFLPTGAAATGGARLCFPLPGPQDEGSGNGDVTNGVAMATFPASAGHPEVVAVGFASAFSNRWASTASHAGLAVRALGHSPRLVWYQPSIGDLAGPSSSGVDPWPPWLGPGAAILALAVVVLALVRGRRMGALVTEPLPVVVRAVETTRSRGRMYRRARDRGRAATILRAATTDRLARRLAVPPGDPAAVERAASTASGMPSTHVGALLSGPPPTTDVELHTLASSLTELEERVRTS